MRIAFIICWFGKLPDYLPIWIKSCSYNNEYDFLLFTDDNININLPSNVYYRPFTKNEFLVRVRKIIDRKSKLSKPYRLCDFRPMYGKIFENELTSYDFWGYCDVDMVFGKIKNFLENEDFLDYEAIFNGGHFTLIKNNVKMNNLYKREGALFNYKIVATKEAIYAFDETTGFQRIAKKNNVKAKFGIPYIETESKFTQLRSRLEKINPNIQGFYWENGTLYRVKAENNQRFYQEIAYIHLQKRKISLLDNGVVNAKAFWITPSGFRIKKELGFPTIKDIELYNPDDGLKRRIEEKKYILEKLLTIIKRGPYQIYVRIKQQKAGINAGDGKREEMKWNRC